MAERHKRKKVTAMAGNNPCGSSKEAAEENSRAGSSTCCSVSNSSPMFTICPLFSRYEVQAQIGDGGQGSVSRVKRLSDGAFFACKTVKIPKIKRSGLIRDEVRILEHLKTSGVAGVVGLVEVIVDSEFWHIILELCTCSLHDRIQRERGLSHREAALLIKRLAKVVEDLHQAGVVHRDLKPPNILLTYPDFPHYKVKVADFGLSVMFPDGEERPIHGCSGTAKYLAPEVVRESSHGKAVDVWGLGLIMYEAVSGITAFESLGSDVVLNRLSWVDSPGEMLDWSGFASDLKEFIMEMLHVNPEMRLTPEQIQTHPWVVKNCEEEAFAPRTPPRSTIMRFKQVNGKWLPVRQEQQIEKQEQQQKQQRPVKRKRSEEDCVFWGNSSPKIVGLLRMKQVNGKWVAEFRQHQQKRRRAEREPEAGQKRRGFKLKFKCVNGLWQAERPTW